MRVTPAMEVDDVDLNALVFKGKKIRIFAMQAQKVCEMFVL